MNRMGWLCLAAGMAVAGGGDQLALAADAGPAVIVAEGERFQVGPAGGWQPIPQDLSYASHTYGGMWVSQGGLLGASADSVGAVATQRITVTQAGEYRVWSKYQAPPYFNYLHQIEVVQGGQTLFSHVYGRAGTERLWSFSGESGELWWPWGVDHDAAEAPPQPVKLAKGEAELRLTTLASPAPAGERCIDFVLLTTNPANDYRGFKPYAVGSPFLNEALDATSLYLRFRNASSIPGQLTLSRAGHFQPQYGGATARFPDAPVAPGQWSSWMNIGPFCRLVHDEGLTVGCPTAGEWAVELARDAAGRDPIAALAVSTGDTLVIPIDVTWNRAATVKTSRQHAEELVKLARTWRAANGGKKARELLFFGSFSGDERWVHDLHDVLGYNTHLPEGYEQTPWRGNHQHVFGIPAIRAYGAALKDKQRQRFISFGDEISLGQINFQDPRNVERFRGWLQQRGITAASLGIDPSELKLVKEGHPKLVWYSNLFNEEERFADYRANTEAAREAIGPHVLTGANYSPHHLALCYGPVFQWVDLFRHQGMSMFWAEDYIFSVPEVPQIWSWMLAQARCGVKYHGQPIHMYVMPHAPGQTPELLRTNMLAAVGMGARHIDSFWVAPAERFTENYVAWGRHEQFRALREAIYDSAEAETLAVGGVVRPARVAVIIGKATDFHESRLLVDKQADVLASRCRNAPERLNQILCRKDQQMLYLALRHAQHAVDLITEDDIISRNELARYDVVYFAGEWIDSSAVEKLDAWVHGGGVLYATAGLGRFDQFEQPNAAMFRLLGIKDAVTTKNVAIIRTLLELPLLPPIDTLTLNGESVAAVGMRQQLVPNDATPLAKWRDGSVAATVRDHGKGKVFAVGTLAGNSYMQTALRRQPFARGGKKHVYHPVDFAPAATQLVRLGVAARPLEQAAVCSHPHVEAAVIDHPRGTLVTLLNWTNRPVQGLTVRVRLSAAPAAARSVRGQAALPVAYDQGVASFQLDLPDADYVLLPK
ncbi:MAG: hypothetical protein U0935_18750 [Pirellulales bacterium]